MIYNLRIYVLFLFFFIQSVVALAQANDMQLVRQRIVAGLLKMPVNDNNITSLINSLSKDGSWPSINYKDVSATGFQHAGHTKNLVVLATAYNQPKSKYYKNAALKNVIINALQFWITNDFIADNWWHNQIGTPDNFSDLMLLIGDELPAGLVAKTQPIIHKGNLNASGARPSGDRIKIAEISAKQFLFLNDVTEFEKTVKVIEREIKFETGKGLQYDYSFHHREDNVNNTLTYGLQFADVFADWSYYLKGTRYAFSNEKIKILIDYYLDGICKMMVFGKYPDVGVKNRDLSREGTLHAMGTGTVEKLLQVSDYRSAELQNIFKIRKNENGNKISFSSFFWLSEYYSQQRPNYFTSARLHSVRVANIEYPYNGEGLLNHHLGDGANYVYTKGTEYYDIFPVWDWQKIPGTTVLQKPALDTGKNIQKKGLMSWVGGVTDGRYGAAVFDFKSPQDGTVAKKSWFFFDDQYVCLGNSIKSDSSYPVVTTLNQCLLNGAVTAMAAEQKQILQKGSRVLQKAQWLHHDNIGYYFPQPVNINISNTVQTGSWYDITHQSATSKQQVSKDVFKLWIDHGRQPSNSSYQYIVIPGATVQQFENIIRQRSVEILQNTATMQAVADKKSNIVQAFFYKPATLNTGKLQITAQSPMALMLQLKNGIIEKITVSDPGHDLTELRFSVNTRIQKNTNNFNAVWDAKNKLTNISVKMPSAPFAGQSVVLKL